MTGRIWGELTRSAAGWSGLGHDTCSAGPVVLGGFDAGARSLSERADRTLGAGRPSLAHDLAETHRAPDERKPRR